jgi:hypothetical protein
MITSSLVHAVKERIIHNLEPSKVIWFGPLAQNNLDGGDEIEMLVVVDEDHPLAPVRPLKRNTIALELFRYRSFGLNLMVVTENEIQKICRESEGEWNFILEIMKEGRVIYDRTRIRALQ